MKAFIQSREVGSQPKLCSLAQSELEVYLWQHTLVAVTSSPALYSPHVQFIGATDRRFIWGNVRRP